MWVFYVYFCVHVGTRRVVLRFVFKLKCVFLLGNGLFKAFVYLSMYLP